MNIVNGKRMNTGMTYLNSNVRKRKNLTIIGNALIDKVLFKGTTANGVQLSDGTQFKADEIILSSDNAQGGKTAIEQQNAAPPPRKFLRLASGIATVCWQTTTSF